jgi:hypothetical protein
MQHFATPSGPLKYCAGYDIPVLLISAISAGMFRDVNQKIRKSNAIYPSQQQAKLPLKTECIGTAANAANAPSASPMMLDGTANCFLQEELCGNGNTVTEVFSPDDTT